MLGWVVRFIGRRIAWKITKEDEIHLKNYYNECFSIDGNVEFAKQMTDVKREEILLRKEINFFGRMRKLF